MANTLRFKRGLVATIPTAAAGEPLFTTDTFDLYIGNGTTNTRFQKYIASGTTSQLLRGDGSLLTMPIVLTSPSSGQVLKYNGTSWVNDSDAGITGSGTTNYLPKFTGATTLGNSLVFDNGTNVGIGTTSPSFKLDIRSTSATIASVSGGSSTNQGSAYYVHKSNVASGSLTAYGDEAAITGGTPDLSAMIYTASSVPLKFYVNNSIRMTLTANGRLLLGTTSEGTELLQVAGDTLIASSTPLLKLHASVNSEFHGIEFRQGAGLDAFIKQLPTTGEFRISNGRNSSWGGFITLYTDTTEKVRITPNGNVGIGTTSPTERLVVRSIGNSYASSAALSIENVTGANKTYFTNANGNLYITNNTTIDHIALFSNGNLALSGSGDSGERLQVNGTMKVTGAVTALSITTSAYSYLYGLRISGNDTGNTIYQPTGALGISTFNSAITFSPSLTTALTLASTGAATFSSSIQAATAIAIGTTPDTNKPFKILKNINTTVGINFENTSTSSLAFSAIQMGTDVTGGTKFTNLVYASSGVTANGVYNPDGTSLINNGSGGLNFLGNPIRMYTGGSNGTLRWDMTNDGFITQYSGTNPTTNATDGYRQYSADVVAGNAAPHFRTENGAVIKLYQETTAVGNSTISVGGGNAVLDDTEFGGYTLRQVVQALKNQGILA